MKKKCKHKIKKALRRLHSQYSHSELLEIARLKKKRFYTLHMGMGSWIRCNLLQPDSKLFRSFLQEGFVCQEDMEGYLIRAYCKYIKKHTKNT